MVEQPACQQNFPQTIRNFQLHFIRLAFGEIAQDERLFTPGFLLRMLDAQRIALADFIIIRFVCKNQRQNALVDEVAHVNAGKALRDDALDAKIQRN